MRSIKKQITLGHDMITEDFIRVNGKESLLCLALLFRTYTSRREFSFNMNYLYSHLGIKSSQTNRKKNLLSTVEKLVTLPVGLTGDQLVLTPYSVASGYYITVLDKAVDTILSIEKRIDKYSLFNTYAILKRYINYETKRAYPSIETIGDILRVSSNNTVINYINTLEEIGLIRVYRSDLYVMVGGKKTRPNNEYEILL